MPGGVTTPEYIVMAYIVMALPGGVTTPEYVVMADVVMAYIGMALPGGVTTPEISCVQRSTGVPAWVTPSFQSSI